VTNMRHDSRLYDGYVWVVPAAAQMSRAGDEMDDVATARRELLTIREEVDPALAEFAAPLPTDLGPIGTAPAAHVVATQVRVDATAYVAAHGYRPGGRGTWSFQMAGRKLLVSGLYRQALKLAQVRALELGADTIEVLA